MRTTININEQILAIAKQKTADRKTTLGAIIEDALSCAVHAYVLMTNHIHFLLTPSDDKGISLNGSDKFRR